METDHLQVLPEESVQTPEQDVGAPVPCSMEELLQCLEDCPFLSIFQQHFVPTHLSDYPRFLGVLISIYYLAGNE